MMAVCSGKLMHGEPDRITKRSLSPLRRACLSLGLAVDARPGTNLVWLLRKAKLGKTAIEYLKFSGDEQARRIVELYGSLNATERKAVTIDYLILAAGADVHHISGVVQEERSRIGGMKAGLLAYMNAPAVVERAIEYALTPDGYHDRNMLLQIAGVIPASPQPCSTSRYRGRGI